MSSDGVQVHADDQGGVQAGGTRQRPRAKGEFFARHRDGMAGNGSAHGLVQCRDGPCFPLAGLSRWKASMGLLPDCNGSRPTEQSKGKPGQSQKGPRLGFRGSQKSMRSMEGRPEQQTRQTKAAATARLAIALAAKQSLFLQVAEEDSQIILHL